MSGAFAIVLIFVSMVICVAWPLGKYIAVALERPNRFFAPLRYVEKALAWSVGGFYDVEMGWTEYFAALLSFTVVNIVALFGFFRLYSAMGPDTAFNAAISFVTNTNWQAYSPERMLDVVSQTLVITTQQFFSPAVGIALMCALARGLRSSEKESVGNFWRDIIRVIVYLFIPLAVIMALVLVGSGVCQSFSGCYEYTTLEGLRSKVCLGTNASQVAIKQLGGNGGGLFGANAAHPLENPTPLSNCIELFAILLVPIALCRTFGEMVGVRSQAKLLMTVMSGLFFVGVIWAISAEMSSLPVLSDQAVSFFEARGNMEGKETRFGPFWSVFWSVATTATANGSVNSSLSSLLPMTSALCLVMMQLGEVVFGGVGTGVVGAVLFLLVAVFSSGLMVGRTPEYLGKKVEETEVKFIIVAIMLPAILVLVCTALALSLVDGRAALSTFSPHGITEVLYAFCSSSMNNGSSFRGLNADSPLYNVLTGSAMYLSRMIGACAVLALAGAFVRKKRIPEGVGTLSTVTFSFGLWFAFVIVLVGALNFLPVFTLGPVLEHVMLFFPIYR